MTTWRKARLGDCCEIVSGATPSTAIDDYWDGDICWATPKDLSGLDGHYISDTPRKLTEAGIANCSARILPPSSVLFSSRAPIGHVAINTIPMATNQGFKSLVPGPEVAAKYLFHWLRANRSFLEGLGVGATFKEVSKSVVAKVEVPLPPISEQLRVAAILDKADALRAKRREALAQLNCLAQSIFVEIFGDPATNPKGWPVVRIGDLLDSASYGTSERSGTSGRFPVLRMNNITRTGDMDFTDLKHMDLEESEHDRYLVKPGDVLFNRTNSVELVGKTAIYRQAEPMAYAGYLIRLRTKAGNDPEYVAAFMNTPYTKRVLRNMCKSIIGMANINATEVQSIKIARPPEELQAQFGQRIRSLNQAKARHRAMQAEVDRLFSSLQHRAFRGEL